MHYQTENEKLNDTLAQVMREQMIKAQAENRALKMKLSQLQKMFKDFENIKNILSLAGDNPDDYIPEMLENNQQPIIEGAPV